MEHTTGPTRLIKDKSMEAVTALGAKTLRQFGITTARMLGIAKAATGIYMTHGHGIVGL